jgi:hypothetical protein
VAIIDIMTHLFTAFQTILPSIIGITWVKLNPESTTVVHCAGGSPGEEKSWPYGIKDAASNQKRTFQAKKKGKNEKQST